jgi:subtilisin family serine protease
MINKIVLISFLSISILNADFFYFKGKKKELTQIKSRDYNSNTIYYQTQQGKRLGVKDQLIISFSNKSIKEYIQIEYSLKEIKQLSNTMYLYQTPSKEETLDIANELNKVVGIKFAQPDFLKKKTNRAYTYDDPLFDISWHLRNRNQLSNIPMQRGADINVLDAWDYTKGKGIVVAVYDEGIDINHEDLRENIIGFENFNDPDTTFPSPASQSGIWHGTSCAGLVAALENDFGSVGVAPQSKILAVRYADSSISDDIRAYQWMSDHGADIITNSWGSYENMDAYNEIFKDLSMNGRNGKGTIIIFAAGNDNYNLDNPAYNDESESEYVLSIAASTEIDEIATYSNHGSSIDFAAPGSAYGTIVTTDATGRSGTNSDNYTTNFSGTSAAAPIVAGAVALMLSENPKLTREDVIEILKYTARKIGKYNYDINGRNDYAGYGRIDAGRAVEIAHRYGTTNLKSYAQKMFQTLL